MRRILNRLSRPVALLIVAAQLLLGVPAVATAQSAAAASAHAPCDEMPMAGHDDGCPCCPDGSGSMKNCLAMCSLAAGITATLTIPVVAPPHDIAFFDFSHPAAVLSDPPLKPPPIA